jgi:phosphatidylserine decarboxylase
MSKSLQEWMETDVRPLRDRSLAWLSHEHFFRDPFRPAHADTERFFSPADGIILYQKTLEPDECLVEIKGQNYSLRDALRDPAYDRPSLVIGIFMTFYDVHVNRIPFAGRLSYRELEPIDTQNHPLLAVEKGILDELRVDLGSASYLHQNQRMVNRIEASDLGQPYYVLQIADYDVDSIIPFEVKQNQPFAQCERFSQIRFGSQVDLIVPLSRRFEFLVLQATTSHVEAGVDPLIRIIERGESGTLEIMGGHR